MNKNLIWIGLLAGLVLNKLGRAERALGVLGALVASLALVAWLLRMRARRRLLARESLHNDYTPAEFEQLIAELFRRRGYAAKVAGQSGDRGIDVVLGKGKNKIGVQCKRYKGKIGSPLIREFIGALDGAGMTSGYFATTSDYTDEAVAAARNSSFAITLLTGDEIVREKGKHG